MQILNIAGYQFLALNQLESLKQIFLNICELEELKGTILLSPEGININLAGTLNAIHRFQDFLKKETLFNLSFHETISDFQPFRKLKIKIKKEIITLRNASIDPVQAQASYLLPHELKQWLDEGRDFILLDTRNAYEVKFGTFTKATHLNLQDFCEFPKQSKQQAYDKPVVTFCTGGIRCEKAALYLAQQGIAEQVYQLKGGILGYFKEIGGEHYQGECFVFDERIAVNTKLEYTSTMQCSNCEGPLPSMTESMPYQPPVSCPACDIIK